MLTLVCALVGVAGSAFPVDIDENKLVGHLKDAIKAKKPDTIKGEADKLQLFLAKTEGGAWLKSKDLLRMRKGEIPNEVESRYMKEELEDPTDKICSKFPSTIPEGSIHVLVVAPEGAGGSASEISKMDQVVQEVHEIHAQTVLTKRKTYVHSKVGSTEYKELLDAFNI
ncbi:hypothetical protein PI124_g24639, partial [Phytophthora idaei]